jgi:hypothetical protein
VAAAEARSESIHPVAWKEFTQVNKGKRRAEAVRPRFLQDEAYRAEVLAAAGADAAREAEECERQSLDGADAVGRWCR